MRLGSSRSWAACHLPTVYIKLLRVTAFPVGPEAEGQARGPAGGRTVGGFCRATEGLTPDSFTQVRSGSRAFTGPRPASGQDRCPLPGLLTISDLLCQNKPRVRPVEEPQPHGTQMSEFTGSFHAGFESRAQVFLALRKCSSLIQHLFLYTEQNACPSPKAGSGRDRLHRAPLTAEGLPLRCPRRGPAAGPSKPASLCLWSPVGSIGPPWAGPHPLLLMNPPLCCCHQAETPPWGVCTFTCASA